MNSKLVIWIGGGVAIVLVVGALLVWFVFFKTAPSTNTAVQSGNLGTSATQTTGVSTNASAGGSTNQTTGLPQGASTQKVFKIADGPVSGATFTQTFSPTTTLARYVLQENGHVMDQPIDVPGSLPRAVSNTTIPGTAQVAWGASGSVAYMQYLDGNIIKTVSLIFPQTATSTKSVTKPVQIQFLPDNAEAVAVSPSGAQVAYLLTTSTGSDGYISNIDGGNAKKLFSIGFSQLLLSWPSANTLLLTTNSAAGVSGIVFTADTKTGSILPLLSAPGLTALANPALTYVLYQSGPSASAAPVSYAHDMKQNGDIRLSFNPIPEKCVASNVSSSKIYCATPQAYYSASYLDQWHQGVTSLADLILSFSFDRLANTDVVATPGTDGGSASDILEMAVSPDDKYLLFIKKGDRSLWGVRL